MKKSVRKEILPASIDSIRAAHRARRAEINARLAEFHRVWREGTDARLWEELVFCIFTAGASARMGLRSVEAVRHLLAQGSHEELTKALTGVHRYPSARPGYIVVTRDYLREECDMRLREKLESFTDPLARRDWLAKERRIKGLGYKEASHFLRKRGRDKRVRTSLRAVRVRETLGCRLPLSSATRKELPSPYCRSSHARPLRLLHRIP